MQPLIHPNNDIFRFTATSHTRWSDEDSLGVLNNAVYLTLLEEARFQYFANLKLLHLSKQFNFVLGETQIRFLNPGKAPEKVNIDISTNSLGNSSFSQKYRVYHPKSQEIWAIAEAKLVIWDNQKRQSAKIPDVFREAVKEFEGLE